jgi:hypothetical protein
MQHAVPVSLFLTRRALCPNCGAPLSLAAEQVVVECEYCGCGSSIERRLRMIEAELHQAEQSGAAATGGTNFIPAHAITGDGSVAAHCPGCGSAIELTTRQEISTCEHCDSPSKVERRLALDRRDPCDDIRIDDDLNEFNPEEFEDRITRIVKSYEHAETYDPAAMWDECHDVRLMVVLTTTNPELIAGAMQSFEPWRKVSPRRECIFSRLLQRIPSLSDELRELLLDKVVRRMGGGNMQSAEARLPRVRMVVRAAARAVFRDDTSEQMLHALTFAQPNAMLKLLLELAEWGFSRSNRNVAASALKVAAQALDTREGMRHKSRQKVNRELLSRVLMYRLLYLPPRLLAWALEQVPRWRIEDYRTLARFIDDCAFERPELIATIRDARIARPAPSQSFAEYLKHLEFVESLLSPQGREYAMYLHSYRAEGGRPDPQPELLRPILVHLLPTLTDTDLRCHAGFDIAQLAKQLESQPLPALDEFMKQHGDKMTAYPALIYRRFSPHAATQAEPALESPQQPHSKTEPDPAFDSAEFRTEHPRESEFLREEERREIARPAAVAALRLAAEKVSNSGSWNPDAKTSAHYDRILREQRSAGAAGDLDLSSPYLHQHVQRISMHWLEYDQTRDPRYKAIIEQHETALEAILDQARKKHARKRATKLAARPLYRVIWDRLFAAGSS